MKIINIGRGPNNDLVLSDMSVSSSHARLYVSDDGHVAIQDLGSTNGTYVDGKRVVDKVLLSDNSQVKVGQVNLKWKALALGRTDIFASTVLMKKKKSGTELLSAKVSESNSPLDKSYSGTVLSSDTNIKYSYSNQKTIGRDNSCDIRLTASDVSLRHAILGRNDDGSVFIMDCGSTNGTYVNGKRIAHKKLDYGDKLLIANKYFVDWEQVFPNSGHHKKRHRGMKVVGVTLLTLLVIAILAFGGYYAWVYINKPKELLPTEIYSKYKKTVVMIQRAYTYEITYEDIPVSTALEILLDDDWDVDISDNYYVVDNSLKEGVAIGYGTGFFISNDGLIMTNRHVVSELDESRAKDIELIRSTIAESLMDDALDLLMDDYYDEYHVLSEIADGLEVKYRLVSMGVFMNDTYVNSQSDMIQCSLYDVSQSADVDIAIIQTNNKTTPSDVTNIVNLKDITNPEDIELGRAIYTIGFPYSITIGDTQMGLEANNQSGEVTQNRGQYTYGHNITIERGASGSPVFDRFGKFAGVIVSGYLGLSQGYNHAVQPVPASDFYNKTSVY